MKKIKTTKLVYMGSAVIEVILYTDGSYKLVESKPAKPVYTLNYNNGQITVSR